MRGAGFPALDVLALSAPLSARAVDALLDAEDELERARRAAVDECTAELAAADGSARRAWRHALEDLRKGHRRPSAPMPEHPSLTALQGLWGRVEDASRDMREAFSADVSRTSAVLRDTGRDPRFREAVIWQNRTAFELGVEWLLRQPEGATGFRVREKERLVARYLQRYAVKNDTIGFFGPQGWGRICPRGAAVEVRPGPRMVRARGVFFEFWAVDALAETLAADQEIRPWAVPRRMPVVSIDRDASLTPADRRLLAHCDGVRPAGVIARELAADPAATWSESDVLQSMERLVQRQLLLWGFELPPYHFESRPERALRRELERIGEPRARDRALGALDELVSARSGVEGTAGEPVKLAAALDSMDETFRRLTGRAETRLGGRTYAGRTVLYEDCVRDLDIEIGDALLQRIGPPLTLALMGARWYSHTVARRFRDLFVAAYRELVRETGSKAIELQRFADRVSKDLPVGRGGNPPIVATTTAELHASWSAILGVTTGARCIQRTVAEVGARVVETFAAAGPGWPMARHCAPDVMIAATDAESIRRGDYRAVLGELHLGNTVTTRSFLALHPHPEVLVGYRQLDVAPTAAEVPTKKLQGMRAKSLSPSPLDFDIEFSDGRSWREPGRVLAISELFVEELDGALRAHAPERGVSFDIIEPFQSLLAVSAPSTLLGAGRGHTPRVILGDLVVARETWELGPAECDFANQSDAAYRFTAARRWARARGFPRFVFVKTPDEVKPWFVDFESPIYVDILAKSIRKATAVTVSEMMPAIDETWLPDAQGRTYTCELRLAAVDPLPWSPAP